MIDEETSPDGIIPFEGPRKIILGRVRNPATFPMDGVYDDALTSITWKLLTADERTIVASGSFSHVAGSTIGRYEAALNEDIQLSRGNIYVLLIIHTTFKLRLRLLAARSGGAAAAA